MKYKKFLLIAFFLTLFVFQQAQAGAKLLTKDNLSQKNSAQASGLPDHIWVTMLHLDGLGNAITPRQECYWLEVATGCGEAGTEHPYTVNPVLVNVENDYLLNVLAREMDVAVRKPTLAALQAQAVASRTHADWKTRANGIIDNTTTYQVFIPYAYDYYNKPDERVEVKKLISDAVTSTSGQYLSYNGESIDAEFGGDFISQSEPGLQDYLVIIQDPISTTCAVSNYNGWGMSQSGALRWSLGNQCAAGGSDSTKWPVTWTDYRQILPHYYTGIDILDASGGKVAPDDRWNLLNYAIPNGTTATAGMNFTVNVTLQNTSIFDCHSA